VIMTESPSLVWLMTFNGGRPGLDAFLSRNAIRALSLAFCQPCTRYWTESSIDSSDLIWARRPLGGVEIILAK
jgi:hypothetical protein